MMRKIFDGRAAFTMVEVIVAILVLALAFVPMLNLFRFGSQGTVNNVNEIVATNYASDLVNFVREIQHYKLKEKVGGELKFENDGEIQQFFRDILKMAPPEPVQEPFGRAMELKAYAGEVKKGSGGLANIKHIVGSKIAAYLKRQAVESLLVTVTVKYPKISSKGEDEVKLFSMVIE